jgi:hypothetical protein
LKIIPGYGDSTPLELTFGGFRQIPVALLMKSIAPISNRASLLDGSGDACWMNVRRIDGWMSFIGLSRDLPDFNQQIDKGDIQTRDSLSGS